MNHVMPICRRDVAQLGARPDETSNAIRPSFKRKLRGTRLLAVQL